MELPGIRVASVHETFSQDTHERCLKKLKAHHFCHTLSLIIPNQSEIPAVLQSCLIDKVKFAYISAVPLWSLIQPSFLGQFVVRGRPSMVSVDSLLPCHDCAALTPSGLLVLSLVRDTYTTLGVKGKPSRYDNQKKRDIKHKWIVELDLADESFKPGNGRWERLNKRFRSRPDINFNFLMSWLPGDDVQSDCQSMFGYFGNGKREFLRLYAEEGHQHVAYIPELNPDYIEGLQDADGTNVHSNFDDAMELLATFVSTEERVDCTNTGLSNEHSSTSIDRLVTCTWSGFVVSDVLVYFVTAANVWLQSNPDVPWVLVNWLAFENSPVVYGDHEHGGSWFSDVSSTIIMFQGGVWWFNCGLGTMDVHV